MIDRLEHKNKQPILRVAKEETEDGFNGFYTNIFVKNNFNSLVKKIVYISFK